MLTDGLPKMPHKIEISHRTIIFAVVFLLSLVLLYQIRQILVLMFIALILMSALNPTVRKLEQIRVPRALAVVMIYLLIFLIFGLAIAGVIPVLIEQTASLISRLPEYLEALRLGGQLSMIDQNVINSQLNQWGSIPANLLKITASIFGSLTAFLVVMVITFYLLIERQHLDRYLAILFGGDGVDRARAFVDRLEHRLGGWVRAQLALMLIVGVVTYIGLRLLGFEFALPLAILAGLLEIVPNLGPTLAALPAVLAGLAISPLMALTVAAFYFLVQQVENSLIVPQIMARGVGIRPLAVIISLAIGANLAGLLGIILAIPFFILVRVILEELKAPSQ
ncbi:hypothetical protein COT66_01570 [Candidatus Shapirobacteria bacterium CG09_land_8_20_14_0_10_49_15]|uniref:AI-2E family transporter n=2 Tax=Candidatus Shapironibacteriota TaxID=1752721 RepID=A0A2M8L6V3_9BACT|nr:MAG: hypothetical protein COT66_01570 [Candidatus Shapirobacteria bacterium CG09_land_8_20_14_0_10_49_15]PJE69928.1 MAG: hypothetical protein COU97_02275 [Candidatus Shapirobacteria bacterium CG10_big_fil_rev_8_21_14_0_10_48_15]